MTEIRRRPQFITDLRQAWSYIAEHNMPAADGFVLDLERRYQLLAERPQLGVRRLPSYPTFRIFPFGNYIIVYSPLDETSGIELIRLLHAARDYHHFFR